MFNRLGGQKAVQNFLGQKYPMLREGASLKEQSDEGASKISLRQKSVEGSALKKKKDNTSSSGQMVKSQVTNLPRPAVSASGKIQPFDQVMSNFAMYGLANRNQLSGSVDTSSESQVLMMQELSGLCLKIYRSVNLRFQRIA